MKTKIFRWLSINVFGTKEGVEHPKWLLILFFPVRYYALEYSGLKYDFMTNTYLIEGVKISGAIFEVLSDLPIDTKMLISKKDDRLYFELIDF